MINNSYNIAVVGLGYVGLPIVVNFGKKRKVIAFDINSIRIQELHTGIDRNRDISEDDIKNSNIEYTDNPDKLKLTNFIIIAVPTPVDDTNNPDLSPLINATSLVGKYINKGSIIVFESTVYPGTTEEICIPILEKESKMKCGVDFKVGYSPERINPGDSEHTFSKIVKVVAGMDTETLEIISAIYSEVIQAGIFKAPSIKVAEAAKIIENTQRDLNIALINELSIIFHKMGIDTQDVLQAASTKWNFLKFQPGLVGGHCIGVDPYYLTYKAEQLGYIPQVILSGRRINDGMSRFIVREMIKLLLKNGKINFENIKPKITVLGLTFKENVSDIRNSKTVDVVRELEDYGFDVQVTDPLAYPDEVEHEYGISLTPMENLSPANGIIITVPHYSFKQGNWAMMEPLLMNGSGIIMDIKGILSRENKPENITLWRL